MGVSIPRPCSAVNDSASGAQVIDGSLKFDRVGSDALSFQPSSNGNKNISTISGWFKRGGNSSASAQSLFNVSQNINDDYFDIYINNNRFYVYNRSDSQNSGQAAVLWTSNYLRDFSGWYHFVVALDSTQSTTSDRVKIYINGIRQLDLDSANYPSQNYNFFTANSTVKGRSIGRSVWAGGSVGQYFDGSRSQCYFIDGQALGPEYFGYTDPLTNTWRPKKVEFPKRTFTNPKWYSSATLYTSVANVVAAVASGSATDRGNGGVTVNNEYCYLVFNDGGYANSGGGVNSPDYPVWTDTPSFDDGSGGTTSRVFYYDTSAGDNWTSAASYGSTPSAADQWNQWRYSNSTEYEAYSIGKDFDIDGGAMLVFCGNATSDNPTNAGKLSAATLPTLDTGSFNFQNSVIDTWYMGGNSFYLPMDGNTPIGKDQSGNGNNWTPVNFGGSNVIPKATGALPILNTVNGGKVATVGVRTDASGNSCVLALPLVGSKEDVSNQINSGSTTKVMTAVGNAAASSVSNFYGGSFVFDGTGDYLSLGSNSDFNFGTGTFTIEGFFYKNATTSLQTLLASQQYYQAGNNGNWVLRISSGSQIAFASYDGTGNEEYYEFSAPSGVGDWHHFALVREGTGTNDTKFYYDGNLAGSMTVSKSLNDGGSNGIFIGDDGSGPNGAFNGYLQDIRVYKGVAKYTEDFIPASTNPDILPDTPSGVSYGSQLDKVPAADGGGVSFDGSGDFLAAGDGVSTDLAPGTGNFTLEFFLYAGTTINYAPGIVSWSTTAAGQDSYVGAGFIGYNDSLQQLDIQLGTSGSSVAMDSGAGSVRQYTWNHIAIVRNTGNEFKVYVNGILVKTDTIQPDITAKYMIIGKYYSNDNYVLNGFISNFRFIKGTALYTSNFTPPTAPLTDVTNTKLLCCQSTTSAIAAAVSPGTIAANGNAAATNFNPFTDDINTVMGQETGYCTLNPLDTNLGTSINDGNLNTGTSGTSAWELVKSTIGVSSGKWYWEGNSQGQSGTDGSNGYHFGVMLTSLLTTGGPYQTGCYSSQSTSLFQASTSTAVTDCTLTTNAWALDLDANTLKFYRAGVLTHTYTSVPAGTYTPFGGSYGSNFSVTFNFGQKPFKYAPPEGFQPLNYANLPSPGVVRSDSVVGVTTYAGDGTSRGPTDLNPSLNFYPDFIWLKGYTDPDKHGLYDTVRGPEKRLQTGNQGTNAQDTVNGVMEFLPNGFRIGDYAETNGDGRGYVAWCWKAGGKVGSNAFNVDDVGYATAAAAGLTGGDITPVAASVGTKQGFSIIQYQGNGSTDQTIPHGLTQAPDFSLIKNIDGVANWTVFHTKATTTTQKVFYLNTNGVVADYSGGDSTWWGTLPGATVFTIGATSTAINNGSNDMISYHWHDVPGLQKFGQWKNNNSNDGTFVELGFRPAIILLKCTDATEAWYIINDERYPNNLGPGSSTLVALQPNSDNSESSTVSNCVNAGVDILSNGFKIRSTNTSDGEISYGTRNYIYAAWAHQPMNNLFGAQSNTR